MDTKLVRSLIKSLITEGGAAGHMRHPFDLPEVRTGKDLIGFFEKAAKFVAEKESSVKIDGVNVSFKLVDSSQGKEFAIDRGSLKPIDLEGVTVSRLKDRFPDSVSVETGKPREHGMVKAGRILLSILNESLQDIIPELKALGMYDDPTVFLNTEFVEGTTNVTEYDENFLAIHGVNQFYEKVPARGGTTRPGAPRPQGVKDPSLEVKYDQAVLNSLISKLNKVSGKYNYKVYGSVPATVKEGVKAPDLKRSLGESLTISTEPQASQTKTLNQWLLEAQNPRDTKVVTTDGKKIGAMSKQVYMNVLNGVPLSQFIENPSDFQAAINGAVFYHGTREMGNDILDSLDSPMGSVRSHEGIVLRDPQFGPFPVKITGDFIVQGLQSAFNESKIRDLIKSLL
jgi:hypothetical protein